MPAQRPRASFEPIPPDFDVRALVEETENFQYVYRISCETIEQQGIEVFEKLVLLHVIISGKPLVVDGFNEKLDPWTFTPKWLRDNHGSRIEDARNLSTKDNLPLTIGHYLNNMGKLTDQFFEMSENYRDKHRQRIYLKDIDCPHVWQDKLKEHLPPFLFYWNESTGEIGGPGAVDEPLLGAAGMRKGRGIAVAGDLMSSLPREMRAENLMCYIGHEGTYTPAHQEMCASLGQNIMVDASTSVGEEGKSEKPGSSIWFMTETKDRHTVAEYWQSVLGHNIEVENHFAQVAAWKRAPFTTYVVEQRPGDFILIPPLAPHQVWNRGTRTMKVAWNRTTIETLEMALHEALPNSKIVCRDEQYKNKAIIYYTLQKYSRLLKSANAQQELAGEIAEAIRASKKIRQVQKDFKSLFKLYKEVLLSEMFSAEKPKEHPEHVPYDGNVTCAYCRGNVFNRFLTCKGCSYALGTIEEEPYDICMECYVMGRSCFCQSNLSWVEQWKWKELHRNYEEWRRQIAEMEPSPDALPLPLSEERRLQVKRSLAEICQEQLRLRPWVDYNKPGEDKDEDESEEEIQVNDDGTVRKTVKKRPTDWYNTHKPCHVCIHRHPKWRMAACTNCDRWWCYGTLWRAFDLMPQRIMEDPDWRCPHCQQVCSAGACRKDPRHRPYEPKGTLLGHDTKKVADARSVECLVDFSVSNLNWIRDSVDGGVQFESTRLQRRREEAERAKRMDPALDDRYAEDEVTQHSNGVEYNQVNETVNPSLGGEALGDDSFIDPALRDSSGPSQLVQQSVNGSPTSPALVRSRAINSSVDTAGLSQYPNPENSLPGSNPMDPFNSVAPPAFIYQDGPPVHEGYMASYPDPNDTQIEAQPLKIKKSKKRRKDDEIKLVPVKRRKVGDDGKSLPPKNDANAQFRKEQEKKQLDEAKKAGRFIITYAAMRGRKKIVALRINSEKLRDLCAQWDAQQAVKRHSLPDNPDSGMQENNVILQSDVSPNIQRVAQPRVQPKKLPSQFRCRVEEDEDFKASRDRRSGAVTGTGTSKMRYEEITLDSDEDNNFAETATRNSHQANNQGRRIPSYLAKKYREDSDPPEELPDDWKDGQVNRRQQPRTPSKPQSQIKSPISCSARLTMGSVKLLDGVVESTDDDVSTRDGIPDSHNANTSNLRPTSPAVVTGAMSVVDIAKSATAMLVAEEDRKAKLKAAEWSAGDSGESGAKSDIVSGAKSSSSSWQPSDSAAKLASPPEPISSSMKPSAKISPTDRSILSRPGMAGKKIRIVSAAAVMRRKSNDATMERSCSSAKASSMKQASPGSTTQFPTIKRGRGRPPKKPRQNEPPSFAPGPAAGGPVKRGRGRPRKTVPVE